MANQTGVKFPEEEISEFEKFAEYWWDPRGPHSGLHQINALRIDYVCKDTDISNGNLALDVGCGGGLASLALAEKGWQVTGVDAGKTAINVAKQKAKQKNIMAEFINGNANQLPFADSHFNLVVALEILEHVDDYQKVISEVARVTKPQGTIVLSTINRTGKAFLKAIVAAEYLLNIVPKSTHHYEKFLKPSELAAAGRMNNLILKDTKGIEYNPFTSNKKLSSDVSVNYIMKFIKN